MLPKINKLKRKKDFARVFKKGVTFQERFFVLKVVTSGLKNSRFGFVVSKGFSNKATGRNAARRKLSEAVRHNICNMKNTIDGVFIVKKELKGQSFSEVESDVVKLLKKTETLIK